MRADIIRSLPSRIKTYTRDLLRLQQFQRTFLDTIQKLQPVSKLQDILPKRGRWEEFGRYNTPEEVIEGLYKLWEMTKSDVIDTKGPLELERSVDDLADKLHWEEVIGYDYPDEITYTELTVGMEPPSLWRGHYLLKYKIRCPSQPSEEN